MVGVEKLEVGDVLIGNINGCKLVVLGFHIESGIKDSQMVDVKILNDGKKTTLPLTRVMHSHFDVCRGSEIYKEKGGNNYERI